MPCVCVCKTRKRNAIYFPQGLLLATHLLTTHQQAMMPSYPIYCYREGCGKLAVYKIAARWSDGVTEELKTYALSCENCLPDWFRHSQEKQKACRLAARESLESPGIYLLQHGHRDQQLKRLKDLEEKLASG